MTDYTYDLFISYKRDKRIASWMVKVVDILTYHLAQYFTQSSLRVFFDAECIEDGSLWPDTVRDALRGSRCMLSFWSADYFYNSEWCMSEWQSFVHRERLIGKSPGTLILPVIRNDGHALPDDIKAYQARNLSDYTRTVSAFWDTPKAAELEDHLVQIAERLAARMAAAPPFDPSFPIVEGTPLRRPHFVPVLGALNRSGTSNHAL